jgi:hypothetical protein
MKMKTILTLALAIFSVNAYANEEERKEEVVVEQTTETTVAEDVVAVETQEVAE